LKFEPDAEIGQISADFERGRFAKVSQREEGIGQTSGKWVKASIPVKGDERRFLLFLNFYAYFI
jgi:hypothetical protein